MLPLATRLRQRADELGVSHAEVARRTGLSERRYAHYVSGQREPDLATLVRIAEALGTTPDWLLAVSADHAPPSPRSLLLDRLAAAARTMGEDALAITVVQAEAVARLRQR